MATSKKQLLEQVKQGDLAGAVQSMLDQMTQLQIVTRIVNDGEGEKSADLLSDSQKICTNINILEGTIDTAVGSGFLSEGAYSSIADGHMNQVAAGCASVRDNIESLQTLLDLAEQANWDGDGSEAVPESEVNDALAQIGADGTSSSDITPDASAESGFDLGAELAPDTALPTGFDEIADETSANLSDVASPLEEVPEQGGGLEAAALGGAAIATGVAAAGLADLELADEPVAEAPLEGLGDLGADLGGDDFRSDDFGSDDFGQELSDTAAEDVLNEDLLQESLGDESLFGEAGLEDALESSSTEDNLADLDVNLPQDDLSSNGLNDSLNDDSLFAESSASDAAAEESLDLGLDDSLGEVNLEDVNLEEVSLEDVSLPEAQANETLDGLDLQNGDLDVDLGDGLNLELGVDPLESAPAVSDETLDLSETNEDLNLGGEIDLGASLGEEVDLGMPLEPLDESSSEMDLEASAELEASGLDALDLGEVSVDTTPDFDDDALAGLDLGGDGLSEGEESALGGLDLGSDLGSDAADLLEIPAVNSAETDDLMAGLLSQPVTQTPDSDDEPQTEFLGEQSTEFFDAPTEPKAGALGEMNGLDLTQDSLQEDALGDLDLGGEFPADLSALQSDENVSDIPDLSDSENAFAALDAEPLLDLDADALGNDNLDGDGSVPTPSEFSLDELQIDDAVGNEPGQEPEVDALALESIDDFDSNLWDEASADATPDTPQQPQRVSRSLESLFAADEIAPDAKAETTADEADPLSALFSDTSLQDLEDLSPSSLGSDANGDEGATEQNPFELDSLESDPFADLMVEED